MLALPLVGADTVIYLPAGTSLGFPTYHTYLVYTVDKIFSSGFFYRSESPEVWHTNNYNIVIETANVSVTSDDLNGVFSYTVSTVGRQCWQTNKNPYSVLLDGVNHVAGDGWVYSGGWLNVTGATVNVVASFAVTVILPAGSTTLYMRNDVLTINSVTGYKLLNVSSNVASTASLTSAGDVPVTFSWQAWITHSNNATTALTTSYVTLSSRRFDGSGLQSVQWNSPNFAFDMGFDALKVIVYTSLGGGGWLPIAVFTSDGLMYKNMVASGWTMNLYTSKVYGGGVTTATLNWGDTGSPSGISGVSFTDADIYDITLYHYATGDFIMAIIYPYTCLFGNIFWGIILFIVGAPLYIRTRNVGTFVFLMCIFGGGSGLVWALIPAPFSLAVWFLFALGLTVVLFRLAR